MSIEKIVMPKLGESVTEGTITNWFVGVGDTINKYDPIAEVLTDKVTAEIPASFSGKIIEILAQVDDTLAVGEVICTLEVEGSSTSVHITQEIEEKVPEEKQTNKFRYSPAVLKLANEHQLDLTQIAGTGLNGRITRKDVLAFIESGVPTSQPIKVEMKEETKVEKVQPTIQTSVGDIEIPVTSVRKAIATNMLRSKTEIPHAWMMIEVDVTDIVNYRDKIKSEFKQNEGFNLTYFSFFAKAVATALKEYPMMNSMWAGDKIIQKKDINLSIAVATEDSLFVPVVKHADELSIKGIAREISSLAGKVRSGKLTGTDMEGGTFTVNNTGSFGSVQSSGIINYPQAAILQVESIVKKPVVVNNNMIAIRDMVNLCLSLDHRVLDGLICGKFLGRVKELLENMIDEHFTVY